MDKTVLFYEKNRAFRFWILSQHHDSLHYVYKTELFYPTFSNAPFEQNFMHLPHQNSYFHYFINMNRISRFPPQYDNIKIFCPASVYTP